MRRERRSGLRRGHVRDQLVYAGPTSARVAGGSMLRTPASTSATYADRLPSSYTRVQATTTRLLPVRPSLVRPGLLFGMFVGRFLVRPAVRRLRCTMTTRNVSRRPWMCSSPPPLRDSRSVSLIGHPRPRVSHHLPSVLGILVRRHDEAPRYTNTGSALHLGLIRLVILQRPHPRPLPFSPPRRPKPSPSPSPRHSPDVVLTYGARQQRTATRIR